MYGNITYGDFEKLKKKLLFKKIKSWTNDTLILEDNTKVEIVMSDWDCCANAGGNWKAVNLDAVITNVALERKDGARDDWDERTNCAIVTLFHNQNPIALADCFANDGNGGYYYSICSLRVDGIDYQVVDA